MSKFSEILTKIRNDVQGLVSSDNVEAIAPIAKGLDTLEEEYNISEQATKDAKENLVKYVKEYAFKDKSDLDTGIEQPMSLEDAFAKAHEKTLENRKEK